MSNEEVWDQIKEGGNADEAAKTLIKPWLEEVKMISLVLLFLSFSPSIK